VSYLFVDILHAARDTCPYFDFRRIPDGTAARLASDIQRDLIVKCAKRDPERLSTTASIPVATITAALSVAGSAPLAVPLPAALQYIRLIARPTGAGGDPAILRQIAPYEMGDYTRDIAVSIQGANAYFTGAAPDWGWVSTVDVVYIPFATDFATLNDAVALPDDAKAAFSATLAWAFARRSNGSPFSLEAADQSNLIQLDVSSYQQAAEKAEMMWLASVSDQRRKVRGTIRGWS